MKTFQAKVPKLLVWEVHELAEKQIATVDQSVSVTLAAHVSGWRMRKSMASRAARVDEERVDEILARFLTFRQI